MHKVIYLTSHTASRNGLGMATSYFVFQKVIVFALQHTMETNLNKGNCIRREGEGKEME